MIEVRELRLSDLDDFVRFTDENIGKGYFSREKAQKIIEHSYKGHTPVSFVMVEYVNGQERIVGVRLTYPPGQWLDKEQTEPDAAYFQSLFIDARYQGQGWGVRLSEYSICALKSLGAKKVICHSWDESPHNSSRRYLDKLGFQPIKKIKHFWKEIDYECTRCGKPCLCTATEMVLPLGEEK